MPQQSMCGGGVITTLVCSCRLNLKMHVIFYCKQHSFEPFNMHLCIMATHRSPLSHTALSCNVFLLVVHLSNDGFFFSCAICVVIVVRCIFFVLCCFFWRDAVSSATALIVHRLCDDAFLLHTKYTTSLCFAHENAKREASKMYVRYTASIVPRDFG